MCQVDRLTAPRVATPGPPLRHRSGRDERRAGPPGPFRKPVAILFEPCVGQHEELAHDGDHRDLPRLSLRDELTVLRAQGRFVTDRRQGRHIEQPRIHRVGLVYRLRVLGQWFDGIRFYAAASSPRRSRRTWAGLR